MIPDEIRELVGKLADASDEGKVNWILASQVDIVTSDVDEDYVVVMQDRSVNVWEDRYGALVISILSEIGDTVVKFTINPSEESYEDLEKLINAARRSVWKAAGIDKIIADIDLALSEGKVLGHPSENASGTED